MVEAQAKSGMGFIADHPEATLFHGYQQNQRSPRPII